VEARTACLKIRHLIGTPSCEGGAEIAPLDAAFGTSQVLGFSSIRSALFPANGVAGQTRVDAQQCGGGSVDFRRGAADKKRRRRNRHLRVMGDSCKRAASSCG